MDPHGRAAWRLGDVASVAAGGLPALAMPGAGLWWFAYVCLVPWLLLVVSAPTARRAALRGWLGGTGFVLAVHHWLLPSVHVFLPVVAAAVGALWAPWAALTWWVLRPRQGASHGRSGVSSSFSVPTATAAIGTVPAGWALVETARSWDSLGGPWGLLGATQWSVPAVLSLASLGGVWLVSWLVVAVNVLLALVVRHRSAAGPPVAAALAGLAVSTSAWAVVGWQPAGVGEVRVAAVQSGWASIPDRRLETSARLTDELRTRDGTGSVDLVVWPESSVPRDLASQPELQDDLARLADDVGAPLLVNVDARRPGGEGIFKSSVLLDATGIRATYDKTRLVPFGEYVPARALLEPLVGWTDAAAVDRGTGDGPVVMSVPDGPADADGADGPARAGFDVGPLVCFESAFPDMAREAVRRGADVVVVQAATTTFRDSWADDQHAALAAVRAVESGRPVVHAALTGITTAVDAEGTQLGDRLGPDVGDVTVYDVPLVTGRTPYVALGDYVPAVAVLVVLVAGWRLVTRRGPQVDEVAGSLTER